MRRFLHIGLVLLVALACQGPRTIPRRDMEDICYTILLQDQQIKLDRNLQKVADTSQVYAAILQEYGYDTEDFVHSMYVYLENPVKMEKIMVSVAEKLEKGAKAARKEVDLRNWRRDLMRLHGLRPDTTWPRQRTRPVDTLRVRFSGDSAWLYTPVDSLTLIPRDSIRYLRDSLWWEVWADSLAARRHRFVRDSLARADSLAKARAARLQDKVEVKEDPKSAKASSKKNKAAKKGTKKSQTAKPRNSKVKR